MRLRGIHVQKDNGKVKTEKECVTQSKTEKII